VQSINLLRFCPDDSSHNLQISRRERPQQSDIEGPPGISRELGELDAALSMADSCRVYHETMSVFLEEVLQRSPVVIEDPEQQKHQ
jgi:hypothetical protein